MDEAHSRLIYFVIPKLYMTIALSVRISNLVELYTSVAQINNNTRYIDK